MCVNLLDTHLFIVYNLNRKVIRNRFLGGVSMKKKAKGVKSTKVTKVTKPNMFIDISRYVTIRTVGNWIVENIKPYVDKMFDMF
jgi:hypothetical protein